jgi:Homeodomain-like domain
MGRMTRVEPVEAQRRRSAVRLYKAGVPVKAIAQKLKQSTSWVYKWIRHQAHHHWTRFRSASRAPHHRSTQTSPTVERRILRLRQQLVRHTPRRLRFAGIGARTIQHEYRTRYGPAPSLSTIHRILKRHHVVAPVRRRRNRYRPHPAAEYPNAVQTTDIITRWIYGGSVVQTFNTIDIYSNDVVCTTHANKTAAEACQHLLHTWKTLGIPDLAQFDNEAAFSGGRYARSISQVVRLCLYFGIPILFTPLGESSYNWPVETFNGLWAQRFWSRHQFSRRSDIPRAQQAFVNWYRTQYMAPRQSDTPARLRQGHPVRRLAETWAQALPDPLPICAGLIQAVRRVSETGYTRFLNTPIRVGKRYTGRYVWLTLHTAVQRLTVWYQPRANAEWRQLKQLAFPLKEPVLPMPKPFGQRWGLGK